jgi:hypothetical protein
MKGFVLTVLSVAATISLASIPARADSNLMRSQRDIDLCHYTVKSDYAEVLDPKNIDGSTFEFIARKMLGKQGCYIIYVPGNPGTYLTFNRSTKNSVIRTSVRWSTNDEISYALSNLNFVELGNNGIARAKVIDFQMELAN